MQMSQTVARISDGAVELGGRPILRGIDVSVSPGEVVAVLGANGSGKSTLVRTMLGLVAARRGEVELFDTPLGEFRDWQRVGFVPQRVSAASGVPASVREVVASGRLSHRRPFLPQRRADREAIEAAIEAVGLAAQARDRVSTLSGGQQQRVLIARAMAGVPDLLVLDEPTAGVDAPSQQAFADALRSIVDRGATIVLVAHELGPLGAAGGPRTGDARRSRGVRRTADRRLHRRGRAQRPPPPRPAPALGRARSRRRRTAGPDPGAGAGTMNLLSYDFMVRALLGALFTGLAAPAVGTYLVQRRLSLMGDGIGHIAVTGVALGLLTGTSPTLTAVIVAVIGATVIELVRLSGRATGDVALALLFYGGIAGGVLLTGIAGQSAATLNIYLFGSITTISPTDVWVTAALALVVVFLAVGLSPQLFAVAQDQEFARVAGLNVRLYNLLVAVMAAVTVTVAMRTVGLLLVSALMVVPVATSQQVARGFRTTLFSAMAIGMVVSLGGVTFSAYVNAAPGATIVLLALAGFVVAYPVGVLLRRRQRLASPFPEAVDPFTLHDEHTSVPEEHAHQHGDDCGHAAVPHGDHVDYVHDGHRHAPHGAHYDEH